MKKNGSVPKKMKAF